MGRQRWEARGRSCDACLWTNCTGYGADQISTTSIVRYATIQFRVLAFVWLAVVFECSFSEFGHKPVPNYE